MSVPISIEPSSTRKPPNQITATLETLSTRMHDREHEREQPAGAQGGVGDIRVGLLESPGLDALANERPHHPDARELLAQHAVHRVDAHLHETEQGHESHDHEADRDEQHRHRDRDEPRQLHVELQRGDDAADREDRRGHQQRERHEHEHLHLLHVVRRCA